MNNNPVFHNYAATLALVRGRYVDGQWVSSLG